MIIVGGDQHQQPNSTSQLSMCANTINKDEPAALGGDKFINPILLTLFIYIIISSDLLNYFPLK